MRKLLALGIVLVGMTQWGCSREFLGGTAAGTALGAAGAGATYEVQAKRQLDQLNKEYENGAIDSREYEIRKNQIRRGSLIY